MLIIGGQFGPKQGGQFALKQRGHFAPKWGGQFGRNIHIIWKTSCTKQLVEIKMEIQY